MATIHSVPLTRWLIGLLCGLICAALIFIIAACGAPTPAEMEPDGAKAPAKPSVAISQIEVTQDLATGAPFAQWCSTTVTVNLISTGGAVTVTGALSVSVTGATKPKVSPVQPVSLADGTVTRSEGKLIFKLSVPEESSDVDLQVDVVAASDLSQLASSSLKNLVFGPIVKIDRIEVTQSLDIGGPFVPGRSTAVIAHLTSKGCAISVTGTLNYSVTGTIKPKIAVKPVTLAAGAPRELVFEPIVLAESSDVDFQVDVVASSAPNLVLASKPLINQKFTRTTTRPYLYYTRIDFEPSKQGWPPDKLVGPKSGDAFARGVLPLSETSWFYSPTPTQILTITAGQQCGSCPAGVVCPPPPAVNNNTILDFPDEKECVFLPLSLIREQIGHGAMLGPTELDVVHGWVYDPSGSGVVQYNGAATGVDRRLAYGTSWRTRGQKTYTHELLHLVRQCFLASCAGLDHPPSAKLAMNRLGWDVGGHLLASDWWSSSTVPPQRKQNFSPIMGGQDTANSWISPDEYDSAISYFGSSAAALIATLIEGCEKQPDWCEKQLQYYQCPEPPVNGSASTTFPCFSKGMIVFRGAVQGYPQAASKAEVIILTAAFQATRIPRYSQASYTYSTVGTAGLPFVLRLWRDKERYVDFPFDARVTILPADPGMDTRFGYFEVTVPFDIADRSVKADIIYYRTNKQSLAYLDETSYRRMIDTVKE